MAASGRTFQVTCRNGSIVALNDPQAIFSNPRIDGDSLSAAVTGSRGQHTAFLRVRGKVTEFWLPVDIEIRPPLEIVDIRLSDDAQAVAFAVRNNTLDRNLSRVSFSARKVAARSDEIGPGSTSARYSLPLADSRVVPGLNALSLSVAGPEVFATRWGAWDLLQRAGAREATAFSTDRHLSTL